jgi:predicted nucleic acid-binding Zn ribbon protein
MPSGDLLGRVLVNVSKDTGSAAVLEPVWQQIAGRQVANAARPLKWEGGTLVFGCASPAWATELDGQRALWLTKLQHRLGRGSVTAIEFRARAA